MGDSSLQHRPRLPQRLDWRIGCLGSGFIMADCHLVAYRQAGLNPVAIASRTSASAQAVADRHAIPVVHATVDDLLADSSIDVLDIAVPPQHQPDIIRRACTFRHLKGILAQKPLAMSVREAAELVNRCEDAGIVLAVNQNMRFDPSIRAMKDLLDRGWLGTPVLATIDMRAVPHWMPWAQDLPSLSTFVMSIHHLDTFRYWFGTPTRVMASTRPDPRTTFHHTDGLNLCLLEWDNGMRASSWDDVWAAPAHAPADDETRRIVWRVEGTDGLATGTIGWPKYPAHTPSTLQYATARQPGVWQLPTWNEAWFPDAFLGTMAQLLVAVETGEVPEIGGRDNLETLALCEAVFASARDHRAVQVSEFLLGG